MDMTVKSMLIVASALSLVVAATASADAKTRKRHHVKPPKYVRVVPPLVDPQYEATRQRYMLLYGGCVSDEGYGRFSPCDLSRPTR
jgi:hypothetical protein